MPIKLKKTNIQYDIETPESGWVFIGVDENGNLVKKDDDGTYEKIVKDNTYGIYLRVESDYFTLGNRVTNSPEGLYSLGQGDSVTASGFVSSTQGKYATASGEYSLSRGLYVTASGKHSYISGRGFNNSYPLVSTGINSFVHSYSLTGTQTYGTYADYSAILGGTNNIILSGSNNSVIIGGYNNGIKPTTKNTVVLGGHDLIGSMDNTVFVQNLYIQDDLYATGVHIEHLHTTSLQSDFVNAKDTIYSVSVLVEENVNCNQIITRNVYVIDSNYGFLKTDGTIDTNRYFNSTGDTMTGDIILSGTTIKSVNTADNTNVFIGAHNFNNIETGSALQYNVVIGDQNTAHFITGKNNVVIGSYNANVDNYSRAIGTMNKNIIIGYQISLLNNNEENEIIIGNNITGKGSDTVSIGNFSTKGIYLITKTDGNEGNVYQTNATILTSDARLKSNVRKLTNDEINAAKDLSKEIGIYTFLQLSKEKCENKKLHIGMTVQRAIDIMKNNNLDPFEYSFISKNENYDETYKKYLDDNILYGFRYTELLLFISCGLEQRISELENK